MQSVENKETTAKCVCVANRPTTHSTNHFSRIRFIAQKSPGPDCPVAGTRVILRHASTKRVCSRSTSILRTKLLDFSRFNTQFSQIVMEAICANTGSLSWGRTVHQDTNPHRETTLPIRYEWQQRYSASREQQSCSYSHRCQKKLPLYSLRFHGVSFSCRQVPHSVARPVCNVSYLFVVILSSFSILFFHEILPKFLHLIFHIYPNAMLGRSNRTLLGVGFHDLLRPLLLKNIFVLLR